MYIYSVESTWQTNQLNKKTKLKRKKETNFLKKETKNKKNTKNLNGVVFITGIEVFKDEL